MNEPRGDFAREAVRQGLVRVTDGRNTMRRLVAALLITAVASATLLAVRGGVFGSTTGLTIVLGWLAVVALVVEQWVERSNEQATQAFLARGGSSSL